MKLLNLPKLLLLAAAICLLAPATASAATKPGTLAGTIDGLPKKAKSAKRSVDIRVIDVLTGRVVASPKPRGAKFSAKLPAGVYMFSVSAIDRPGTAIVATSKPAKIKPGKTTRKSAKAKRVGKKVKKKRKKSKRASISAEPPASAFDPTVPADKMILGVDPAVAIKGLAEYPKGLSVDSLVITDLSQGCPSGKPGFTLVEIRNRDAILKELALADSPYFDKNTTARKGKLWKERQIVRGSGTVANGRLSFQLKVVDLATGEELASAAVEGSVKNFFDLIADADAMLLRELCSGRVDVTINGTAAYHRHEGNSGTDLEHVVDGNFNFSITYKNVRLKDAAFSGFGAQASASGSWVDNGRYGAEGPGNFSCGGPVIDYIGEYATAKVTKTLDGFRITAMPYFTVQGDVGAISCSGLPGPPHAFFSMIGNDPSTLVNVDVDPAALDLGPITKPLTLAEPYPADCSNLVGGPAEPPCSQTLTWSGTVTVSRAAS